LAPFVETINAALSRSGLTGLALAERVAAPAATVADWLRGGSEPNPEAVRAIDEVLGLMPGHLSRRLPQGYVPVPNPHDPVSVREAVLVDELLDDAGREALLAFYDALTKHTRRSFRRRPS
jgi:hypothetical protein